MKSNVEKSYHQADFRVIKKLKQLKIEIKEKKRHIHDSVHYDFGGSFITKESKKKEIKNIQKRS